MNKPDVSQIMKGVKDFVNRRSPEILTGIGIAGMITTTVLAVKATPKALEKIEEKKVEVYESLDPNEVPSQAVPSEVKLTKVEIVKAAWKPYIPAVITGATSIVCLVGASKTNLKRNAALATAYNVSQTALDEYKKKVVETIGEKKEQKVRESIAQDKANKDKPKKEGQNVIVIGEGKYPCYDPILDKEFYSDKEAIREAVNNVNEKLLSYDYVSLNEFYDELGLAHTKIGDDIGWNISRDGQVKISFDSILNKDGKPALVLNYTVEPRYDYSKLM